LPKNCENIGRLQVDNMELTSSVKRPESLEISPYVGPRPYERNDRNLFYGRDNETMQIISLILSNPVTLIYSQSGVGKTSLFNTRIIYELEKQYKFQTFPSARVRSLLPSDKIPKDVNNLYMFNALLSLDPDVNLDVLKKQNLSDFLKERRQKGAIEEKSAPRVIVFDQLEELFGLYPENWYDQQQDFFQQIAEALNEDRMLRIVLVIREEFLAHLPSFANLVPGGLRSRFRLQRLRKEAALLAITEPLKPTGRSFAPGVAEKLVGDLLIMRVENIFGKIVDMIGEYVEPVHLQVVCQRLWMKVVSSGINEITEQHLKGSADVNKALTEFYLDVVSDVSRQTGINQNAIRNWFDQKLITSSGTRGIVNREAKSTGGMPNNVVDLLQQRYIIRPEWRSGSRWYELTHDRLIGPVLGSNKVWKQKRKTKKLIIISVLVGAFAIGLVAVLFSMILPVPESQTIIVNQRIVPVGDGPTGVAFNPDTNTVYVTNSLSNTTSVIDGTENTVQSDLSVGTNPVGVAVNPDTGKVYVTNSLSNTTSVIFTVPFTIVSGDLPVGTNPVGVAVNPDTNMVYVTNSLSNTTSVIDGKTSNVIANVTVGGGGVAVNPDTNMVYVTNSLSNTTSVIDGTDNTFVENLSVGTNPVGVAVNPISKTLYVTNQGDNSLSVIDLDTK
jgi:YVTN family beta-propeller protein